MTFEAERESVLLHLIDWKNPYSTGKPEDEDPMMMVSARDFAGGSWPMNKEVERRGGEDSFARSHRAVKRAAYAVSVREPYLYAAVMEAELFFNSEMGDRDYEVFVETAKRQRERYEEEKAKLLKHFAGRRKQRLNADAERKTEETMDEDARVELQEQRETEKKAGFDAARERMKKKPGERPPSKATAIEGGPIKVPKAMGLAPLVELFVDAVTAETIREMDGEPVYALHPERMLRKTDKRVVAEAGYRKIFPVYEAVRDQYPGWSQRKVEMETGQRTGHARSTVQKAVEFCRTEREIKERTQA